MNEYYSGDVKIIERDENCERHGPFVSRTRYFGGGSWGGSCEKCMAEESAETATKEAESEYRSRIAEAGIPNKFASVQPIEYGPQLTTWLAQVKARASTGPLLLTGPVGTGKTHTAIAVLKDITRAGFFGRYVSAIEYGRRVRETWSGKRGEETEQHLLDRYSKCAFLVLDELGANRAADENIIQDLICGRYDAGRMPSTIVVTNLAASALQKALGERATDRIKEGATLLSICGDSRRRPAA